MALVTELGYSIAEAPRSLDIGPTLLGRGNVGMKRKLRASRWVRTVIRMLIMAISLKKPRAAEFTGSHA